MGWASSLVYVLVGFGSARNPPQVSQPLGASPERNNMPILLFGILIGAIITAVVVMIFLVFAAKSYKQFSKIMDRLIDWAERF